MREKPSAFRSAPPRNVRKIGGQHMLEYMLDHMLEQMLEHIEGYEKVPRARACLDSAGFQISGCAFKHGDALCMSVACAAAERADWKSVMFIPMADAKLREE